MEEMPERPICHVVAGPNGSGKSTFALRYLPEYAGAVTFCHKGGVICISEVIDISPGNLDSSLCFLQPSVSHDVLCIEVN